MDESSFVLLLLSGLFWINSALFRQYHYINLKMSWPEAQRYCRERFTDLATVDNMDDVNRLVNITYAGYRGSVWIGLKRGTETHWVWSNGENKTSQYSNWASGNPIQDIYCVTSYNGVWYSALCENRRFFTCYKENNGYIMVNLLKNWSDAQSYCRQYYTDLPLIHNAEENVQLTKILYRGWYIWFGLFQDCWEWSDKWSFFFRHWVQGQPNQIFGSGDCVGMTRSKSGTWARYSCDLQTPFICYGEPKFPEYQFMYKSMTWQDAQSYCRARFTDLATVETMEDVNRLQNAVDAGYSGSVWIGLHNRTGKRWIWSVGDGALSYYTSWSVGEPAGDGECVRTFNGSWYDESCSTILPFVCFNVSTGFVIINTSMAWGDAQSYCRQHHTDLASISSPDQQDLMNTESSLWIGLFLDSWEWSYNWSFFFRHWSAGQPYQSSESGGCASMSTTDYGKWAQYSCNLQQPFICQGDDILIKKQIIRLKLSCDGQCTWDDPSLQTAILNQISEKLKSMGLESVSKIIWRE